MWIVLTGGAGAGKTAVSRILVRRWPDRFAAVPEAATQIYEALQTRWDRLDLAGRRDVQRRIYHLQLEQEARIAQQHPDKILLLDRGTVDGAAYWPEGPEDYWRTLQTTPAAQFARYSAVIWLETCAAIGLFDGDRSNPVRYEDPVAALALSDRLRELWRSHDHFYQIRATPRLEQKVAAVCEVIAAVAPHS